MMRLTTNILKQFSRSQNFFQMNPIYPDLGQKDFDIYNSDRKTINVLDIYEKRLKDKQMLKKQVRKHFINKKVIQKKQYVRDPKIKKMQTDQNNFILGLRQDFDNFAQQFRKKRAQDANLKTNFNQALTQLVRKYKTKSQIQLIKLFRLSIAFTKKNQLIEKMKGHILQQIIRQVSKNNQYDDPIDQQQLGQYLQQKQEEEYQKLLKSIDDKITQAQGVLNLKKSKQQRQQSNYHPQYGYKEQQILQINLQRDLNLGIGHHSTKLRNVNVFGKNVQDKSIKSRLNKLYFLRRLQLLKQQRDSLTSFHQDLPLNLRNNQNLMNKIAHKYKQYQLYQQPDIKQIYRDLQILMDKIYVKINPTHDNSNSTKSQQVVDSKIPSQLYLWQTLDVQQVLAPTLYSQSQDIQLSQQTSLQVSPNPKTQISMHRTPINFHRHSQLDIFGVYSSERSNLKRGILDVDKVGHQPSFRYFQVQESKQSYNNKKKQYKQIQQVFGRATRKKSQAQVRCNLGSGRVIINGIPIRQYFADYYYRVQALKPLLFTQTADKLDLQIQVVGGGSHGQSQCIAFALSRALMKINPDYRQMLNAFGLVGTDYRVKEAKKMNKYSARVRPPYKRR